MQADRAAGHQFYLLILDLKRLGFTEEPEKRWCCKTERK